jgi:hypothetical protein
MAGSRSSGGGQSTSVVPTRVTPSQGKGEDGAAVDGVHEADRLGDGKAPGGEDEVTAAQGADAPLDADLLAQMVGPRAGGVDDGPGTNVDGAPIGRTGGHVAQADADQFARFVT